MKLLLITKEYATKKIKLSQNRMEEIFSPDLTFFFFKIY